MKGLNRILLTFLALVGILIFGAIQFVQSEQFARFVSKKFTKRIERRFDTKIKFKKIKVQVFPPATYFENVEGEFKQIETSFKLEKLGIQVSIFDLFLNRITLDKISLIGGDLKIKKEPSTVGELGPRITKNDIKDLLENIKDLFPAYKDFYNNQQMKIKSVEFDHIYVDSPGFKLFVNNAGGYFYKRIFEVKLLVESLLTQGGFRLDEAQATFQLTDENLRLASSKFSAGSEILSLSGTIGTKDDFIVKDFQANLSGALSSLIPYVKDYYEYKDLQGDLSVELLLSGNIFDPEGSASLKIDNLVSEYALIDQVRLKLMKKGDQVDLVSGSVDLNKGKINLLEPVPLYDFKSKKITLKRLGIDTTNIYTNDYLYFLREDLNILKGSSSGRVALEFTDDFLIVVPEDDYRIEHVALKIPGNKDPIIHSRDFGLNNTYFKIYYNGLFELKVEALHPNSKFSAQGFIDGKNVDISYVTQNMEMPELGPIGGIDILGRIKGKGTIKGNKDSAYLNLSGEFEDLELVELFFGRGKAEIQLDILNGSLTVLNLESRYGQTIFNGSGKISFADGGSLDVVLDFERSNYNDSKRIYGILFNNFKFLNLSKLDFSYDTKYSIKGPIDPAKMKISGILNAKSVVLYDEEVQAVGFNFVYDEEVLSITNIRGVKGSGLITGNFSYGIGNGIFEFDSRIESVKLKDFTTYDVFNLGLDGDVFANIYGSGSKKDFSGKAVIDVENSTIGRTAVDSSKLSVYLSDKDIFAKGSLLGEFFTLDSYLNFLKQGDPSYVNIAANVTDLRTLLAAISEHNIEDERLMGILEGTLYSKFDIYNFDKADVAAKIENFLMRKDDVRYVADPNSNQIKIKNGIIERWDIAAVGGNSFFKSTGKGSLGKGLKIGSDFLVETNLFQFFTPLLINPGGSIEGKAVIIGDVSDASIYFESSSDDVSFSLKGVPSRFHGIGFNVIFDKNEFFFRKFKGKFGDGDIRLEGGVTMSLPFPDLHLTYSHESIKMPILEKSFVVTSGNGTITGTKLPYKLKGSAYIEHGEVLDGLASLVSYSGGEAEKNKFLPQEQLARKRRILDLDIALFVSKPVLVRNVIADMAFVGSGKIKGSVLAPEIFGTYRVVPVRSKFLLKGHEFLLNEGHITLQEGELSTTTSLNFSGAADIAEYNVVVGVSGRPENLAMELTSTPPLDRQDILSLLTLGITANKSKNIQQGDLENVTSLSLGTLLFDQFGLNKGLNSSLGLKLSVSPEVSEDDTAPIAGRIGPADAGAGKLRSSTKIKVQRKISKNIDLSVSSTVGGSADQRQEMNLNFNLNKNLSIQGIYEMRSNTGSETTNQNNSGGIDFIWRKTFK